MDHEDDPESYIVVKEEDILPPSPTLKAEVKDSSPGCSSSSGTRRRAHGSVETAFCVAPYCHNSFERDGHRGIRFFRFPRHDRELALRWRQRINRLGPDGQLWQPAYKDTLCSAHFVTGKKSRNPQHVDYVPSLFSSDDREKRVNATQRLVRRLKRTAPTPDPDLDDLVPYVESAEPVEPLESPMEVLAQAAHKLFCRRRPSSRVQNEAFWSEFLAFSQLEPYQTPEAKVYLSFFKLKWRQGVTMGVMNQLYNCLDHLHQHLFQHSLKRWSSLPGFIRQCKLKQIDRATGNPFKARTKRRQRSLFPHLEFEPNVVEEFLAVPAPPHDPDLLFDQVMAVLAVCSGLDLRSLGQIQRSDVMLTSHGDYRVTYRSKPQAGQIKVVEFTVPKSYREILRLYLADRDAQLMENESGCLLATLETRTFDGVPKAMVMPMSELTLIRVGRSVASRLSLPQKERYQVGCFRKASAVFGTAHERSRTVEMIRCEKQFDMKDEESSEYVQENELLEVEFPSQIEDHRHFDIKPTIETLQSSGSQLLAENSIEDTTVRDQEGDHNLAESNHAPGSNGSQETNVLAFSEEVSNSHEVSDLEPRN